MADAAFNMAQLYQQQGNKELALKNFQSHFENAKSGKNTKKDIKLIDKARVLYGISKAKTTIGSSHVV